MKKLPKDIKTMSADNLFYEYRERQKALRQTEEILMSQHKWHGEETASQVAKNQKHTKTAQKHFQLKNELDRIETALSKREDRSVKNG